MELKADLTAADVGAYNQEETNQRFQPLGNYTSAGYSYGKEESDNRFQPKGNYQPVGNYALKGDSYIKSESDGKYQPKGNYLEAGYSYSKGESDDKYQSRGNYQPAGNYQPTGNYASAASQTFTGEVRAPNIITGAVNNQSFFFQRDGVWTWTVQQNGSWRGEIGHPGRGGVFSLQGDSYTKGESDGKYQPRGNYQHAGNYQPAGNYAVRGECYTRGESDSRYSKIDRNSMQRFAWPNNGQNPMNFGRNCSGKLCVIEFSHEGAQTITFIIPNQNFGFMHVTCGGAGELRFRINPNRIEKIQTWDRDVVAVYIEY
ncbi:hypothetical protein XBI1_2970026 [Xenorhabdus bovienii str. Intermedium]|uniref:Phage tail fiber protein n=1 Tax=Xenorhabdus bovienii str. Intermedium TaxID=1379677 RepID=A0A077QLI6_XENBV|nr:hypothetical protein XBI1_2970026 [Xenorhabdus bovienii str. Intermedium]